MVKMDVDEPKKPEAAVEKEKSVVEEAKPKSVQELLKSIESIVPLLESAVKARDTRMITGRLLRLTAAIRVGLGSPNVLPQFLKAYLVGAEAAASRSFLLQHVPEVRNGSLLLSVKNKIGQGPPGPTWTALSPCACCIDGLCVCVVASKN